MGNSVRKILLVDDEERLLNSMEQRLSLMGFDVVKATSGTQAIDVAAKDNIDLAIVDLKMPDMDGLMTITKLKQIAPELKTVLLTGYGSAKTKQQSQSTGSDYFEKDSMSELWNLIKSLNTSGNMVVINPSDTSSAFSAQMAQRATGQYHPDGEKQSATSNVDSIGRSLGKLPKIIGETHDMQELRKNIERLSGIDCTIIIRGETGTGKELAARAIHALSHRKDQRFLAFNCGCFSTDFHFKELLGSLRQSTLHQNLESVGVINKGFVGTIFLDHFEVMPEKTQQEMLKIIEQKTENHPVKSTETVMDIRFIIATHRDLKKRAMEGKFNKQLFKKLNAIEMSVPSLRDRKEDILPLCSYFLQKLNKEFDKQIESFSDEVFSILSSYAFPGNVRELKHIIERAVILSNEKTIQLKHLPERLGESGFPISEENKALCTLKEIEYSHIRKIIQITKGNKSKAAEMLGISRAALWRKLKLIDI